MKRTLLLLSFLLSPAVGVFAQSNSATPTWGVGLSYGAPLPPNASTTPYAGGLIFRLEYPVNNSPFSVIFKTGFSFYAASDVTLGSYDPNNEFNDSPATGTIWSFVPVEIGGKFYVVDKLYLEGDAGVSFFINYHPGGNQTIAPIVSPCIGYDIPFKASKNNLDLGFSYENRINYSNAISDFSQVSFHAIFNFGM